MGDKIHIIGGGTYFHVRNHFALAAPAHGETARKLYGDIHRRVADQLRKEQAGDARISETYERALNEIAAERVKLHLTKMAAPRQSNLVTNADVEHLIDELIADPDTRVIIMNAALCDYEGDIVEGDWQGDTFYEKQERDRTNVKPGKYAQRLKTSEGIQTMVLAPAPKLIGKIRKERKDIFVVGFKTTTDATSDEQYQIALNMLKRDSLNLVLANDTVTRNNMIVAPEETRYFETTDRDAVLKGLVDMVLSRSTNTFTRSTVKHGDTVPWDSPQVPDNLRTVVNHLIERGAYKPFRGVTAGHFAVRIDDKTILTSKRKVNFNELDKVGLVQVEYEGDDKVIAFGAKPSVGGQSQRQVFRDHPGFDCIVHAHVPLRNPEQNLVPVAPQWQNECGSHQCGANTSRNLAEMPYLDGKVKAVMLDGHGPNVVFTRDADPQEIIRFIEANFDLSAKTGGLVENVQAELIRVSAS